MAGCPFDRRDNQLFDNPETREKQGHDQQEEEQQRETERPQLFILPCSGTRQQPFDNMRTVKRRNRQEIEKGEEDIDQDEEMQARCQKGNHPRWLIDDMTRQQSQQDCTGRRQDKIASRTGGSDV